MLQRTRAEQVVPIYKKFLKKYPNIKALSLSSVKEIQEIIEPLGLRKRALGIFKMGKQIAKEYDGEIPDDKKQLLRIHWIGNYISNAILCHAYGRDVPTVDANFARVLKRVFLLDISEPAQKDKRIWELAAELVPKGHGQKLNFAVLDLAAMICTPRKMDHENCPLEQICGLLLREKNKGGSQHELL